MSAAATIAEQLRAAWPTLRRINVEMFEGVDPWSTRTYIKLTGSEDDLVSVGLVAPEDLQAIPPCGVKLWRYLELRRSKSGVRALFTLCEIDDGDVAEARRAHRAEDAVTRALANWVWTPPRAAA